VFSPLPRGSALGVILGALTAGTAAGPDGHRRDLVGQVPPDLVAADGDWLAGPPATLAGLKGKVVWLQFNF